MTDKVKLPEQQDLGLVDPNPDRAAAAPAVASPNAGQTRRVVDLGQIRRQQSQEVLISQLIKLGF